eukprot:3306686-Pleurochrysis_carterae.AAC.2
MHASHAIGSSGHTLSAVPLVCFGVLQAERRAFCVRLVFRNLLGETSSSLALETHMQTSELTLELVRRLGWSYISSASALHARPPQAQWLEGKLALQFVRRQNVKGGA